MLQNVIMCFVVFGNNIKNLIKSYIICRKTCDIMILYNGQGVYGVRPNL